MSGLFRKQRMNVEETYELSSASDKCLNLNSQSILVIKDLNEVIAVVIHRYGYFVLFTEAPMNVNGERVKVKILHPGDEVLFYNRGYKIRFTESSY